MSFVKKPELVVLIRIPASGKSTLTEKYEKEGYLLLSSDTMRREIYGTGFPTDKKERDKLRNFIYKEIREGAARALSEEKNVIIDSTNLTRKKRLQILRAVENIEAEKTAILLICSPEECHRRNAMRPEELRVPEHELERMIRSFECPMPGEGWDRIIPIISEVEYRFPEEKLKDFSQDNPHHSLSLGEHMEAARRYAEQQGYSPTLTKICYLHDMGKLYTKVFENSRGEPTNIAHFYGHDSYGAYLYLCAECCGNSPSPEEFSRILYEANLIGCHMRPMMAWSSSKTAKIKDEQMFGKEFVCDIEKINAADKAAINADFDN